VVRRPAHYGFAISLDTSLKEVWNALVLMVYIIITLMTDSVLEQESSALRKIK
jgi:hypothetical protein